jgi:hypothetical protein
MKNPFSKKTIADSVCIFTKHSTKEEKKELKEYHKSKETRERWRYYFS